MMRALRILLAILLSLSPIASIAAEAEYFRLGIEGGVVTGTPPDPDTNNPDEGDALSYPKTNIEFGDEVTIAPSAVPEGATYFDFDGDVPAGVSINHETGAVTWHANARGPQTVWVYAEGEDVWETGYLDVEVPRTYEINVSPPTFTAQQWSVGVEQTFTATTSPSQPTPGASWSIVYDGGPELDQVGPSAKLDMVEVGSWGWGESTFQFVRTDADGVETYSDPVEIDIGEPPSFSYPDTQTANYRIDNGIVQVLKNAAVSIPAVKHLGAATVATPKPSFINLTSQAPLPPGLTLNADGSITGTASTAYPKVWKEFVVQNSAGNVYGTSQIQVMVVNELVDPETANGNDFQNDLYDEYMWAGFPNWSFSFVADRELTDHSGHLAGDSGVFGHYHMGSVTGHDPEDIGWVDHGVFQGVVGFRGAGSDDRVCGSVRLVNDGEMLDTKHLFLGCSANFLEAPINWVMHIDGVGSFARSAIDTGYPAGNIIWDVGTMAHFNPGQTYHVWFSAAN